MRVFKFILLLTIVSIALNACAQSKQATANKSTKNGLDTGNLPQLSVSKDVDEVKASISDILHKIEISDKKVQLRGWPKDILVLNDRIKLNIKNQDLVIFYSELGDYNKESLKIQGSKYVLEGEKIDFIVTNWTKGNAQLMDQLRQNLLFMKNQANRNKYDSQLDLFKPVAVKYRELKVKPNVSEEQRKFIVQANAFNEQKNYSKAIELYNRAMETDPTAYPAGYSNLALLLAQINDFGGAICNMKKYLMLEPDTKDARSAQDKIYEWEAMEKK